MDNKLLSLAVPQYGDDILPVDKEAIGECIDE